MQNSSYFLLFCSAKIGGIWGPCKRLHQNFSFEPSFLSFSYLFAHYIWQLSIVYKRFGALNLKNHS